MSVCIKCGLGGVGNGEREQQNGTLIVDPMVQGVENVLGESGCVCLCVLVVGVAQAGQPPHGAGSGERAGSAGECLCLCAHVCAR